MDEIIFSIEDDPRASNYGNEKGEPYNIDSAGKIWLQQRDRLIQLSNGTYVVGVGNPLYINDIGWRYDYREVLTDEIPFKLPVTMPLDNEYK